MQAQPTAPDRLITPVPDVIEPSVWTEAELVQRMNDKLKNSAPDLQAVGEQLAQMALEARINYESGLGKIRRRLMAWGGLSYSSLSAVVSAAVGGTVLALNELPTWVRYAVAAIALAAAAIGALNPARYYAQDHHRNLQYWSFHRWTWQYILIDLPNADLAEGRARLKERSAALDAIRGVQSPDWGRVNRLSGVGDSDAPKAPVAHHR